MSEIETLLSALARKYQTLERAEMRLRATVPDRKRQAVQVAAERAAILAGLRVLVTGEVSGPPAVDPPEA